MSGQQHRASRCVFVGNIPYDATEEQLVQICEEVGPVVSFRLVVDRDTGKPKGYGFCEFRDEETALSARRNLQGYEINGRQLRVDFAENEKGGGGVDRNRDQQGRGGPGFQQSAANIDVLKHGGLGAPQHYGIAGGPGALEQPMGRAAASAAAVMMAGALGGAQQMPNMMLPPQAPLQSMPAPSPLAPGNGAVAGTDALTNHLAGMSKYQLYEIMSQMKIMIQQNQQQARQILVSNPQLTKALFQAQIMLGMVRPQQVQPQAQTALPQQPANLMPQQQPRPPQPHAPPPAQIQPQAGGKSTFQPPLPQAPQLQQQQAQQPQQQQPQPHLPQGGFQQGGLVQTSMGMPFQPGQPPPPSQPPPQQMYQMGASMVTMNMPRMVTTSSGGPVGLGNNGLTGGAGPMGPGAQLGRGPGLSGGAIDNRGVQLNQGPPASVAASGVSGVHGQPPMPGAGPMTSGHPMPSASGGMVGMGGALPSTMSTPQMMGDARAYSGQGMNFPMNQGMNGLNPNMNLGMSSGMNQAMNISMSAPQTGGFVGPADGTTVTSTAMQPQPYSQVQMQMPAVPQQSQIQVPLELEQQKALLQQVMNLTTEQIMSLPPEQRQQVLQLQQALR